jgi:hypothetical protein
MDAAGTCAIILLLPPASGTANRHELARTNSLLLYFTGTQVTEKKNYGYLVLYLGWATGLSY